jgi:hypothetical protein
MGSVIGGVGPGRMDLLDVVGIDERGLPVTRSPSQRPVLMKKYAMPEEELYASPRRESLMALSVSPLPSSLCSESSPGMGPSTSGPPRARRAGRNGFVRYWLREGSRVRAFSQEKRSYVSVREGIRSNLTQLAWTSFKYWEA